MAASPTGVLFYEPRAKPLSTVGSIQPGAYYQFYLTGTLTLTNVYADGNLVTPLSQTPGTGGTTAASDGRLVPIYMNPATTYRVQLYSFSNQLLEDIDPYIPAPIPTADQIGSQLYPILVSEIGVTHDQYPYGDLRRYGGDPTGAVDSSTAITNAQTSSTNVIVPPGTFKISNNITLARANTYTFIPGGMLSPDASKVVQVASQIQAGGYQIFTGAGTIGVTALDYTNGPGTWNVKWWGAKGDGVTDDTTNFQKPFTVVTQGEIFVPAGQYNVLSSTSLGLGIVVAGTPSIRGEGFYSIINGVGFTSSAPIMTITGTNISAKTNMSVTGLHFLSNNSGAAALSIAFVNNCNFLDIYLETLATGIVCGTNVFTNIWRLWHQAGVVGRQFIAGGNGGFNNNMFLGGRFGGGGFVMQHVAGGNGGNTFYQVDFEGLAPGAGVAGIYIAPTGTGTVRGFQLIGSYSENNNAPMLYATGAANSIYGIAVIGCYLNGQNGGATYAITAQNVNGITVRGNDFDAWQTAVINNLGGNSNWDVGPNDVTNTPAWSSDSGLVTIATGGTITTSVATQNAQIFANPSAGAATGVILSVGLYDGQTVGIANVNGSNSITMAAAATSHVASGTGCVIAAGNQKVFTWRSTGLGTAAWFSN